jgi:hypothetical protein
VVAADAIYSPVFDRDNKCDADHNGEAATGISM